MAEDDSNKIFIDEDWKARVQREKEEAAAHAATEPPEQATPEDEDEGPIEASFEGLVSGLAMQSMMALGVIAPPDSKEVMIDLAGAKFAIDMLMVLREKTKGNLEPEEQGYLTETLADLQQTFVVRSQQMHEAALRQAGFGPGPK